MLVLDTSKRPAQKYFDDLVPSRAAQELIAALEKIIETPGWVQIGNVFKPIRHVSGIWQVTAANHRWLGFRKDERLVLTHGFRKTGVEAQKSEIAKAAGYRGQFP